VLLCFLAAVDFFAMVGNPFASVRCVGTGFENLCVSLYLTR
jgi:hypothetical protein